MGKQKQERAEEQSLLYAAETAEALRRGWRPPATAAPIAQAQGETVVARVPAAVHQFSGADVPYSQGFLLAGGGLGMIAATAVGSAIFNSRARNRAAAQATPQWRVVDQGELFLTNLRLAIRGAGGFWEIGYEHVHSVEVDSVGLILWPAGMPTIRLAVGHPAWLSVMYAWLAFDVIAELPLTDEQHQEVARCVAGLPAPAEGPPGQLGI